MIKDLWLRGADRDRLVAAPEVEPAAGARPVIGKRTLLGEPDADPWLVRPSEPGRLSRAALWLAPEPVAAAAAVQRKAIAGPAPDADQIRAIAGRAVASGGAPLPFLDTLQRLFGRHDLGGVRAHTGDRAAAASRQIGARAFAAGDHVVLGDAPDLHTVAHEAAHVVQQRAGLRLAGGVGQVDDAHERQADAVADAVVAGRSVEALLAPGVTGGEPQVQLRTISLAERRPMIELGDEDEVQDGRGYIARVQQGFGQVFGVNLAVTGGYDAPTAAAIVWFQAMRKLPVTGRIDRATWIVLERAAQPVPSEQALVVAPSSGRSLEALPPIAHATARAELGQFSGAEQVRFHEALMSLDRATLGRVFVTIHLSPLALQPVLRASLHQVVRPLMLGMAARGPAPRDPGFPVGGPGGIEHIHNSCYAASILTLIAAVPQYVELFDPARNVIGDYAGQQLQLAMSPLITRVRLGQVVDGGQMATLITTLDGLNMLPRHATDPAHIPTTALPHDAGEVLALMLDPLIHAGNRSTFAAVEHTDRAFDRGGHEHLDQAINTIDLEPGHGETFEDALIACFANRRSGPGALRPFTEHRRVASFPDVLTMCVSHQRDDHHRVDAPKEFTIPTALTPDGRPGPRYRLQAFMLRNNYARRGGHYVAFASDGRDQWFQSDDLGGGPPPVQEPVKPEPTPEPTPEATPEATPEEMPATTPDSTSGSKPRRKRPNKTARRRKQQATTQVAKTPEPTAETTPEPTAETTPEPQPEPAPDIHAPAVPRVEAQPLVQRVDLAEASYADAEDPAFAMGHIYTYVLVRDGELEDEREQFADLGDFPEYQPAAHEHDATYINLADLYARTVEGLQMFHLVDAYESQLAAIETQIAMISLGLADDPSEVAVIQLQLETLYQHAWDAHLETHPLPKSRVSDVEPNVDEPPSPAIAPRAMVPPDRLQFVVPLLRLQPLLAHDALAEEVAPLHARLAEFNAALTDPSQTTPDLVGEFRELLTWIDANNIIGGLPTWFDGAERGAKLDAVIAVYQLITTDLPAIKRLFAEWARQQGDQPGHRVDRPGNRPEEHSQVVEELGPASSTTNKSSIPIPYPSYDRGTFSRVGPVDGKDRDRLLALSRDGGLFNQPVEQETQSSGKQTGKQTGKPGNKPTASGPRLREPDHKSVREGITGLAAAKQNPALFGNILRGPTAIEFFDSLGKPWDVKTPPSRTRDKQLIASTQKSIGKQLTKSHATYDHKRETQTGTTEPVSVLLDVTYLEDWDWIELWFELAESASEAQLSRIYEIVVPLDPRRGPVPDPEQADVEAEPGPQGKGARKPWSQPGKRGGKAEPAKPEPSKARGKQAVRGGKPASSEPEPIAKKGVPVETIYRNARFLESARTGAVLPGGSAGLPIPVIRESALAETDVIRAVTDVALQRTNGTYRNHRGYLPAQNGVLIEYHASDSGFPDKSKARLVWDPHHRELYTTGTHYEAWYETYPPDFAWRCGFYRVELSQQTLDEIARLWGPRRDGRPDRERRDPDRDGGKR